MRAPPSAGALARYAPDYFTSDIGTTGHVARNVNWTLVAGVIALAPSLLVRLKSENPEAWRRLADLYGPVVYEWCRRAGLQAADARCNLTAPQSSRA